MKASCENFFRTTYFKFKAWAKDLCVSEEEKYTCMNDHFKRAPRTVSPSARNTKIAVS